MISHMFTTENFLKSLNSENQKLDQSFSSDENDWKSNTIYHTNTYYEKNICLDTIFKENDSYLFKSKDTNYQMNSDNFSDLNEIKFHQLFEESMNSCNEEINTNRILFKNDKIFNIKKINRKIGRIKKDSSFEGKHNKLSEDNIIRKIKRRFHEKLRLFINKEYQNYLFKKFLKRKNLNNWIKKIDPKVSRKIKKDENIKWFQSKIYEVFSENVSLRYSCQSLDLNKKKIEKLFLLGDAKNVIQILNEKIETYFDKYINDEKIDGFKTLKDDIKELRIYMESTQQKNIDEYLKTYEYVAKNMKQIFYKKKPKKSDK